jgi:hypothetical protein
MTDFVCGKAATDVRASAGTEFSSSSEEYRYDTAGLFFVEFAGGGI